MTIYENGIDSFREQQRKEAIERHEKQQQLQAEQRQREQEAREAARLPFHDEMKQLAARAKKDIDELQPGDIYATAKLRQGLRDAFTILQYCLAALDERQGQQEAAGEAETGKKAAGR